MPSMYQTATETKPDDAKNTPGQSGGRRDDLPPAAQRALQEAAERRVAAEVKTPDRPTEIAGRDGPEPVRFGDWEKNGLISDF